jgi:predicted RNase H-like HicB family nuclease
MKSRPGQIIIKDDTHFYQTLKQLQREREALGIQIDGDSLNRQAAVAERYSEREYAKIKSPKSRKQIVREFALLITPAPDGEYLAYCPAIYGCYSRGKTPARARKQLSENIRHYLSNLAAVGKPLPRSNGRIGKLKIAMPV